MSITVTTLRFMAGSLAILSWCSLLLQWILIKDRLEGPIWILRARYFSYFTILSNLLVALCFSLWFAFPTSKITDPALATGLTAVCLYIIIVSLIYYLVLRKSSGLIGLHKLVSSVHHSLIPLCYILIWQWILPPGLVQTSAIWTMLILPILYFGLILYIGKKTKHYPYPFVDVNVLGYSKVLRNALLLSSLFALLAYLLILWKS